MRMSCVQCVQKPEIPCPMGLFLFPAWILMCCLYMVFNVESGEKSFALSFIALYTLIPTIVGIAMSWSIYNRKYRTRKFMRI